MMELEALSRSRIRRIHPDLIAIVEETQRRLPFKIRVPGDGGWRTKAQQKSLVARGLSWTMDSKHRTGHAVDLVALIDKGRKNRKGEPILDAAWTNPHARTVAEMMKAVADERGIDLTWGGDWKKRDTPHFELSWDDYPKADTSWHALPAKTVLKKSRKHRAAGWSKLGMGITGGITAGWPAIKEQITIGQDIVATMTQVVAANALIVVSGICIISAITFNWLQQRQREDYAEGRYTPSGADGND